MQVGSSETTLILIEIFRDFSQVMENRWFETQFGEWISSIHLILPAALDSGVYLAFDKNEYRKQKNIVSGE
jgi:hypothetical protein